MISTAEFKKGVPIMFKGQPYIIVGIEFQNPGKGQAFYRVKLKNLKTGQVLDNTFKSGETAEEASLQYRKSQYLYNQGNDYFFMDMDSYEQFSLDGNSLGDQTKFLKEGMDLHAMYLEGNPCAIKLPNKVEYKVVEAEAGVKGDTASGGDKVAKIETGAKIKVPLFVKEGDTVKVNTETGLYDTRVS